MGLCVTACAPSAKLPPLPTPGPDYCLSYNSYRYSPAAAQVEAVASLVAHNTNEAIFHEKCLSQAKDRKGGPR